MAVEQAMNFYRDNITILSLWNNDDDDDSNEYEEDGKEGNGGIWRVGNCRQAQMI